MPLHARLPTVLIFLSALAIRSAADDSIDFRPVAAFLKLADDMKLGPCSGVDIDSRGNVYVIQRQSPPILCFDSSGKLLRSWGTALIDPVINPVSIPCPDG